MEGGEVGLRRRRERQKGASNTTGQNERRPGSVRVWGLASGASPHH